MVKIFLDAGHGGNDGGAQGNGLSEKVLTLDIAKRIEAKLEANYKNVEIMQSRTTDTYLTLKERTDKANAWGADILLSIHINSATTVTAKGFESFIYTNASARTKAFQNVLHAEIMKAIGEHNITDRGKKQANFHMLRESKNMSAVLTENLFIINSHDANLLKNSAFLDKLATGHVIGIEKFLGLEKKSNPPPIEDTLYQVIVGTFAQRENAEGLLKKLKADGYDGYISQK